MPAGAKCHAGASRGKEISYQDFGAKEAAGIFDHVAQKPRRSCPVDLAVSHLADGRCGPQTAIRSSKLHVAQAQGTPEMITKKQSQLFWQGSEMVKYGS